MHLCIYCAVFKLLEFTLLRSMFNVIVMDFCVFISTVHRWHILGASFRAHIWALVRDGPEMPQRKFSHQSVNTQRFSRFL